MACAMSCGPHQFSPHWIGVSTAGRDLGVAGEVVRQRRLLDPAEMLVLSSRTRMRPMASAGVRLWL